MFETINDVVVAAEAAHRDHHVQNGYLVIWLSADIALAQAFYTLINKKLLPIMWHPITSTSLYTIRIPVR